MPRQDHCEADPLHEPSGRARADSDADPDRPASASLAPSMRWPNGTVDGQAASHPRHWTQVSIVNAERGVERRAVELDRPHRRDPSAW